MTCKHCKMPISQPMWIEDTPVGPQMNYARYWVGTDDQPICRLDHLFGMHEPELELSTRR